MVCKKDEIYCLCIVGYPLDPVAVFGTGDMGGCPGRHSGGGGKKKLLGLMLDSCCPDIMPADFGDGIGTDRFSDAHLLGPRRQTGSDRHCL